MHDLVEREIKISWADRIIGLVITAVLFGILMPMAASEWYYYPYLFIAMALCVVTWLVVIYIMLFVGGKKTREDESNRQ